ncbi:hypothetical protein FB567DRAFT_159743 [Paraphoma chrysanthemicola]|uniref:Uncharacterized protein n=1 Tax=Paraphoma chrysanthemicola TaxID=798071 RepID=A0A8K0W2C2_9PLEO|nr:hypothetical protein FB567DRAFT_159743 [Paraphoma chrysanthemicola]
MKSYKSFSERTWRTNKQWTAARGLSASGKPHGRLKRSGVKIAPAVGRSTADGCCATIPSAKRAAVAASEAASRVTRMDDDRGSTRTSLSPNLAAGLVQFIWLGTRWRPWSRCSQPYRAHQPTNPPTPAMAPASATAITHSCAIPSCSTKPPTNRACLYQPLHYCSSSLLNVSRFAPLSSCLTTSRSVISSPPAHAKRPAMTFGTSTTGSRTSVSCISCFEASRAIRCVTSSRCFQ